MKPENMSPAQAVNSPQYKEVTSLGVSEDNWYPSASICVVQHLASGKYYRAVYAVRDDDDDYNQLASWTEVALVPVQRDVWRVKK